jgi:hypothetical protein
MTSEDDTDPENARDTSLNLLLAKIVKWDAKLNWQLCGKCSYKAWIAMSRTKCVHRLIGFFVFTSTTVAGGFAAGYTDFLAIKIVSIIVAVISGMFALYFFAVCTCVRGKCNDHAIGLISLQMLLYSTVSPSNNQLITDIANDVNKRIQL